jgi:hypothetical protein
MQLAIALSLIASVGNGKASSFALNPSDSVRIVWLGCNRLEKKDWEKEKSTNPSSANIVQLTQTLRDIDNLSPRPQVVFITGDMVMGYADDQGETLRKQLEAWTEIIKSSSLYKHTKIIAIAGNHELNTKVGDVRKPNRFTTKVWNDWVRQSGFFLGVTPGPKAEESPEDELVDDQTSLNGTLRIGNSEFILLNTDVTNKRQTETNQLVGAVPTHWFQHKLDSAEKDPSVHHVFALGHRNLISDNKDEATVEPQSAGSIINSISKSKKFVGYLCSHWHLWDLRNIVGTKWQAVEGRGGSKLEDYWQPSEGLSFGFSMLEISGSKVSLMKYSRPVPKDKYNGASVSPATLVRTYTLAE